jgi:hypothetical protein
MTDREVACRCIPRDRVLRRDHRLFTAHPVSDLCGVDSDNLRVNIIGRPIRFICFFRNRWPDIESE